MIYQWGLIGFLKTGLLYDTLYLRFLPNRWNFWLSIGGIEPNAQKYIVFVRLPRFNNYRTASFTLPYALPWTRKI